MKFPKSIYKSLNLLCTVIACASLGCLEMKKVTEEKVLIQPPVAVEPAIPNNQTIGTETGNGGDVLVCRTPSMQISSIELLDYFEARFLRKISIDLGGPELSVTEKVQLVLERLRRFSPTRADLYQTWLSTFQAESHFVDVANLADIPDSELIVYPANCSLQQIAIQKEPSFPEDSRYLIDQGLWKAMDNNQKAGLILHELIYREAISLGHKNSKNVRYFNSILSSNKTDEFKPLDFVKLIARIQFKSVEYHGLLWGEFSITQEGQFQGGSVLSGTIDFQGQKVSVSSVLYYKNGQIERFRSAGDFYIQFGEVKLRVPAGKLVSLSEVGEIIEMNACYSPEEKSSFIQVVEGPYFQLRLNTCELMTFYPQGSLKRNKIDGGVLTLPGGVFHLGRSEVQFSEDEHLIQFEVPREQAQVHRIGDQNFKISGTVTLNSSGNILSADVGGNSTVSLKGRETRIWGDVSFYPQGQIKSLRVSESFLFDMSDELNLYQDQRLVLSSDGRVIEGVKNSFLVPGGISFSGLDDKEVEEKSLKCFRDSLFDLALQVFNNCPNPTEALSLSYGEYFFSEKFDHHFRCSAIDSIHLSVEGAASRIDIEGKDLNKRYTIPSGYSIPQLRKGDGAIFLTQDTSFGESVPLYDTEKLENSNLRLNVRLHKSCLLKEVFGSEKK